MHIPEIWKLKCRIFTYYYRIHSYLYFKSSRCNGLSKVVLFNVGDDS